MHGWAKSGITFTTLEVSCRDPLCVPGIVGSISWPVF